MSVRSAVANRPHLTIFLALVLAGIDNARVKSSTTAAHPGPPAHLEAFRQLFNHVPDTVFFAKDRQGRYLAVNDTLARRCGLQDPAEAVGRTVANLFPPHLADRYAAQDAVVLLSGRPITDRLELHWYARNRDGWCLTTKLPIHAADGSVTGLIGISRDLRAPGDARDIPAGLARAIDHLETRFSDPLTPATLADLAGLPPVRFARLIKRVFRISPNQWIAQTRLAAAARMLRDSPLGIAEIAVACGYYDHSAFTRAFRSATGTTPTAFRRDSA